MSLGTWVNNQRQFHTKNTIRLDRKELLDEIGFVWRAKTEGDDEKWLQQYKKLVEFKQKNGHCMVPSRYKQDKAFGRWVGDQRARHANNKVRPDQKYLLDELGFSSNTADGSRDKRWNKHYEKLVEC